MMRVFILLLCASVALSALGLEEEGECSSQVSTPIAGPSLLQHGGAKVVGLVHLHEEKPEQAQPALVQEKQVAKHDHHHPAAPVDAKAWGKEYKQSVEQEFIQEEGAAAPFKALASDDSVPLVVSIKLVATLAELDQGVYGPLVLFVGHLRQKLSQVFKCAPTQLEVVSIIDGDGSQEYTESDLEEPSTTKGLPVTTTALATELPPATTAAPATAVDPVATTAAPATAVFPLATTAAPSMEPTVAATVAEVIAEPRKLQVALHDRLALPEQQGVVLTLKVLGGQKPTDPSPVHLVKELMVTIKTPKPSTDSSLAFFLGDIFKGSRIESVERAPDGDKSLAAPRLGGPGAAALAPLLAWMAVAAAVAVDAA